MIMGVVFKHWIYSAIQFVVRGAVLIRIVLLGDIVGDIDDALDFVFRGLPKKCAIRPLISKCGNLTETTCAFCSAPVCELHLVGDICIHCAAWMGISITPFDSDLLSQWVRSGSYHRLAFRRTHRKTLKIQIRFKGYSDRPFRNIRTRLFAVNFRDYFLKTKI